ncbi:MAG: ABC transporter ATP-binding protein [Proteobacteria bacterium]|nr:ABC transporter ATP-binding protein [Pseudomonadota bacterium]
MTAPLLEVEGLRVEFPDAAVDQPVIDGLSLAINAGEAVALVGESGSGKSMTALSLMRLLPPGAAITGGSIKLDGRSILELPAKELDRIRGNRIAMLFQQPQAMLDPTCRVGLQVAEPLRLHRGMSRDSAARRVIDLLRDLGISDPEARARSYAHELSGGMAQRVMMAAALSADPALLIADEPTTSLDVTVQAQILRLLDQQRRKRGLAILLITHDLSIVAAFAERVAVMYAGRIIEEGLTSAILSHPRHPYTRGLVQCSLLKSNQDGVLFSIPGGASQAYELRQGCRFLPRCETAAAQGIGDRCRQSEPPLRASGPGCRVRCWAEPDPTLATAGQEPGLGRIQQYGNGRT